MSSKKTVTQRTLLYLGGFDPRGARFYHQLYKDEAAKADATIKVEGRKRLKKHVAHWQVSKDKTATDYQFLEWDDIVRKHWLSHRVKLTLKGFSAAWHYIISGAAWKGYQSSRTCGITLFYPAVFLLASLTISILLGLFVSDTAHPILGVIAAVVSVAGFLSLAERLRLLWLLRLYVFCNHYAMHGDADLQKRAELFADHIADALSSDSDELLLVAHSVGAIVLIPTLAALFTRHPDADISKLSILTLGHPIPLVSYLPEATAFHDDLRVIADKKLHWVDFSSKPDGACVEETSPYAFVCEPSGHEVKLLSPRFHTLFDEPVYKALRRDKYRLHFQYLSAADKQGEYDYFAITAGDKTLKARYG